MTDLPDFYEKLLRLNETFIREMGTPGILEIKVSKRLFESLLESKAAMLCYSTNIDHSQIHYKWLDLNFSHGSVRIYPE